MRRRGARRQLSASEDESKCRAEDYRRAIARKRSASANSTLSLSIPTHSSVAWRVRRFSVMSSSYREGRWQHANAAAKARAGRQHSRTRAVVAAGTGAAFLPRRRRGLYWQRNLEDEHVAADSSAEESSRACVRRRKTGAGGSDDVRERENAPPCQEGNVCRCAQYIFSRVEDAERDEHEQPGLSLSPPHERIDGQ